MAETDKEKTKNKVSAFDAAVKYLAVSPRSEKEVRDRLYKKGYHKAETEEAIARAKGYGYIDDAKYVEDFVEYYGAKSGRKQLEYKLVSEKGISPELARNGIADALSDEEEREKALETARKCARAKRITEKKDLQKVGAFLYRKGFERDMIDSALNAVADELFGEFGDITSD